MFDRVELIKALNPILELMFDGFCQARSTLAIYRKVRKNSLSAQFSVERYIVLIIKSFSSSSRSHHQVVLIIKSFSSSSRSHHQVVLIKSFSSSRLYQVVLIIKQFLSSSSAHHQVILSSDRSKSIYQVNLSSQSIKSIYQVNLSSHLIKSLYQVILSSDRSMHTWKKSHLCLLGWPQSWVSDMSNSPTRFNSRIGQKFLFDESNRILTIVRRSNSTREIVRNLKLDKIR